MKRYQTDLAVIFFGLLIVERALALTLPATPPAPVQPAVAEVSVAAKPGSVCRFDPRAMPSGAKSPIIPTDRTGHAHIYLSANAAKTKTAISIALVCEDAQAKQTSVTAHITPTDFIMHKPPSTTVMKMPVANSRFGALPGAKIDVTRASDSDLERLGYPARPDKADAARAYAAWLYIVTTPGVYSHTPAIILRGKHAGPSTLKRTGTPIGPDTPSSSLLTSNNWSGYAVQATPTFTQINGFWAVPTVIPPPFTQTTASVQWVGIDGGNEPDVIQAGTEADSIVVLCSTGNGPFDFPFPCNASFYSGWYEYYPDDQMGIRNFLVRPGDSIQTVVYTTGSGSGVTGHFIVWNMTVNQADSFTENTPGGVSSALDQVEWIVERPTWDNDLTMLCQTTPTTMVDAAFTRNGAPEAVFNGATQNLPISQIAMTQNGAALTPNNLISLGVQGTSPGRLSVFWYKFQ